MSSWSWWAAMPCLYSATAVTGLWATYFIAVGHGRIVPLGSPYRKQNGSSYAPYISLAGNFPPASCLFSLVLNLSAYGGVVLYVFRFLQVKPILKEAWLNVSALGAMSLSCCGMTIVGNYQTLAQPAVHNSSALVMFVMGTVACWLQSWITIKINIKNEGMKIGVIRVLLSVVMTISMLFFMVLDAQGHLMPAAQWEWVLTTVAFIFHSTFIVEFRYSHFETVWIDSCPGN